MTTFKLLSRPHCYIVLEEPIMLLHTVVVNAVTVEVHTTMLSGTDFNVRQNNTNYEKYRCFATWNRFEDAMPGTARCISESAPEKVVFPFAG